MQKYYKIEPHAHTCEISSCGQTPAAEQARLYAQAGFQTLFITDHFFSGFTDRLGDAPWSDKVTEFYRGYRLARDAAPDGLCVLPGFELRVDENLNDYLVYGVPEDFLYGVPDILGMTIKRVRELVNKAGGLVIQAHPFRSENPLPDAVDGFEVFNMNPRHLYHSFNEDCLKMAREHNLIMTGGSDAHRIEDVGCGGLLSDTPVESAADFVNLLKRRSGVDFLSAM